MTSSNDIIITVLDSKENLKSLPFEAQFVYATEFYKRGPLKDINDDEQQIYRAIRHIINHEHDAKKAAEWRAKNPERQKEISARAAKRYFATENGKQKRAAHDAALWVETKKDPLKMQANRDRSNAGYARKKKKLAELKQNDPVAYQAWLDKRRARDAASHAKCAKLKKEADATNIPIAQPEKTVEQKKEKTPTHSQQMRAIAESLENSNAVQKRYDITSEFYKSLIECSRKAKADPRIFALFATVLSAKYWEDAETFDTSTDDKMEEICICGKKTEVSNNSAKFATLSQIPCFKHVLSEIYGKYIVLGSHRN